MGRTFNRSGDQLREIGDVEREEPEIFLRRFAAPIDVNGVGDRLKREETDSDRKENLKRKRTGIKTERVKRSHRRIGEKVEIFKKSEKGKADPQRQPKGNSSPSTVDRSLHHAIAGRLHCRRVRSGNPIFCDSQTSEIINRDHKIEQSEKPPIPPSVEYRTGDQQQDILPSVRQTVIQSKRDQQKYRKN